MQNENETAIHVFILGIHGCSTPGDLTAHSLLRTACGKDIFCENCREYALIEKSLFVASQIIDDWPVFADSYGPVTFLSST